MKKERGKSYEQNFGITWENCLLKIDVPTFKIISWMVAQQHLSGMKENSFIPHLKYLKLLKISNHKQLFLFCWLLVNIFKRGNRYYHMYSTHASPRRQYTVHFIICKHRHNYVGQMEHLFILLYTNLSIVEKESMKEIFSYKNRWTYYDNSVQKEFNQ